MFSLRPVFTASLALLIVLVLPSASVVVAQPQDDVKNATTLMPSDDDKNTDSSSLLLTNFDAMREEGQGFYLEEKLYLFETPGSAGGSSVVLHWWCDLEFSSVDATNNYGYVGRGVGYFLGSTLEDAVATGAQIFSSYKVPLSVSAVMVPTSGIFEGQIHPTQDDWVFRYWDDGSSTLPLLGWKGHDEGDTSPNADTSALSSFGTLTKITTEEAAKYLGMGVGDMTPAACSMEYEAAWNATYVPDPIDTSVIALEETVAQLQANNKELLSRIAAIEGSLTANGSGGGDDGEATATSSSSLFMIAAFEHATMDSVMKSIVTAVVIIGLVVN